MHHLEIVRKTRYSKSIGGELSVDGKLVCRTLELPWNWNRKDDSCVPGGTYWCFWRADRGRIQLESVPAPDGFRTEVQIHRGNVPRQSRGCILVGISIAPNVVNASAEAMRRLEAAISRGGGKRSRMRVTIGGILLDGRFDDLDWPGDGRAVV